MRRTLLAVAMVAAIVAVIVASLLPPRPLDVPGPFPDAPHAWRGAFHVHSQRSDGAGSKGEVAAAAARVGLDFVIFTEHGDATQLPDPPMYLSGVLCVDGIEVSTSGGHYIAIDMPVAPYPLGGEPAAVVEDVRRFGGFGIVAHPDSPKPALAWRDRDLPFDGIEWLNADSAWRDEGVPRLVWALAGYFVRPSAALAALLDRPQAALDEWDRATASRQVVGLAADDAHGGEGRDLEDEGKPGRRGGPSYDASFGAFSLRVLAAPRTGDPTQDARVLLDGIRAGHVFTAIDAFAEPAALQFEASRQSFHAGPGDRLGGEGPVRFLLRAAMPRSGRLALVRGEEVIAETTERELTAKTTQPGAYRVEVRLDRRRNLAPWLLSNPVYVDLPAPPPRPAPAAGTVVASLEAGPWRVEADPASPASIRRDRSGVHFEWTLAPGGRTSQFAALAVPLPQHGPSFDAVGLTLSCSRPARVSVQVRQEAGREARWRTSAYVDSDARRLVIPLRDLAPVPPAASGPVPRADLATLLLVFDLVNTAPSTSGTLNVAAADLLTLHQIRSQN